jgi:hypothetical protein
LLPFFLPSPFLNSTPGLAPGSGANTWKRKANAKDRKRIERTRSQKAPEKKIKLERKRSQKLGEKKGRMPL